jgi:hypothetical protein
MTRATLLAGLLLVAAPAAAPAGLFPPGWSAKHRGADSTKLPMPAALVGAQGARGPAPARYPTRVKVWPSPARVGLRLTYRGDILVEPGARVRFDRPQAGGEFTWGEPRTGRTSVSTTRFGGAYGGVDSVWIEVPLQVFATGPVAIPGPLLELVPQHGSGARAVLRLPAAHVLVLPTITAADTNAQLRALHGPVRAPWWERVPWTWVAGGLLAVAAVVAVVLLSRRRKPAPVAAPTVARPVVARDPGVEALAELRALRALHLPEEGRFGDHALALTRILRRYLEAVVGTPRPGDTSGELVARLRQSRLPGEDVERLEGLLGLWDRVKFARAPVGIDEAHRCEDAVEALVRRRGVAEVA